MGNLILCKSGRGQPHSKTLARGAKSRCIRQVLECGCPLPLSFPEPVTAVCSLILLVFSLFAPLSASAADTLNWRTNQNRVSADIEAGKLIPVLEQIALA